ncbi:MAG: hypothetical protein R3D63_00960 [Paracoccaceae bacterium]
MKRLAPILLLSACVAASGPPVPQSVRLTDQALVLSLSDGARCSVDWAAAPVGRLDGCGPGYGYAVTVEDNPNILRQLVQGIVLALGGRGVLAPMAEVVITDPAGIDHVFTSPARAGD